MSTAYCISPFLVIFIARRSYASAVLGVVILSAHPSVCLSHACFVTKPNNALRIFDIARKGNHSSFLTPTVWAMPPSVWNLRPNWTTPFEKRPLRQRQISAYNVSNVGDSENYSMTNRKSTTGFPMSCRWITYVTFKSPKGWLKSDFLFFFCNFQFQSNKVCYKVSLCEKFQRQRYSITIPPYNGR